ncbi:hypothetical protein Neosp_000063 [[Neocosmospora] mangrovei]
MSTSEFGSPWIWHPDWVDHEPDTAGRLVFFRKTFAVKQVPKTPIHVNLTADTRYRLYINSRLVHFGPVKGDENRWFYDTIDIQPFLLEGDNIIVVEVLRYFHATTYATTFARMPIGGLYLRTVDKNNTAGVCVDSDATWETAIDLSTQLRIDEEFDLFLHIFEKRDRRKDIDMSWKPAKVIQIEEGWGISLPWRLSPRMIPHQAAIPVRFRTIHNVRSNIGEDAWKQLLVDSPAPKAIHLSPGTTHHIELEAENHMTAFLAFRFGRDSPGSQVRVTYSECYEDEPFITPYARRKGDRCDTRKSLIGPSDYYILGDQTSHALDSDELHHGQEIYRPFHFRTFRFIALDIEVCSESSLVLRGIDVTKTNYPLAQKASVKADKDEWVSRMWEISVRTLENCTHDCYEDCPFYEQLQYPMDTRSSCLFTYLVSGDDRLARQAMVQMNDSFVPSLGHITSRSGSNCLQRQVIPAFSLYWICMVTGHYEYYADASFVRQFIAVADGILQSFDSRLDQLGLVPVNENVFWEYTDWTRFWVPQGIPTALKRTKHSTYVNCLYAYTLKRMAWLLRHLGREGVSREYEARASALVAAIQEQCFDGEFFTDGLATKPIPSTEYSQHCQIWAVLCGAATGTMASHVLTQSIIKGNPSSQFPYELEPITQAEGGAGSGADRSFTMTSISFSFYKTRALAAAGDEVYNKFFHEFWATWKDQLKSNVSTWAEDSISVRSDCHAWGSVPIYEFLAELAGIKPASPGWATVSFKPRLQLVKHLDARVPIRTSDGPAIMQVVWKHEDADAEGKTSVNVKLCVQREDTGSASDVSVLVMFPGQKEITVLLSTEREWKVLL